MKRLSMKPILESRIQTLPSFITIRKIAGGAMSDTSTRFRKGNTTKMETDRLISLGAAGQLFGGICAKTVRRRIAAGEFPKPVYVGRKPLLSEREMQAFIERLKEKRRERA